jgi:diguanylate cyclase (GGDEF)-like protein
MAQRDAVYERDSTGAELILRSSEHRRRAMEYRAQAAAHRAQAAQDRAAAASDREHAARERAQWRADREALALTLALSEIDPLTGSRTRAAGLAHLAREHDRCRRTGSPLIVVHVDVVGRRRRDDSEGHEAGDRLLERVVARITERLRSYDLIIRLGGDEFLCAMSDMTLLDAQERFSAIARALAESRRPGTIRCGFAELLPGETMAELIARADSQLIDGRR